MSINIYVYFFLKETEAEKKKEISKPGNYLNSEIEN